MSDTMATGHNKAATRIVKVHILITRPRLKL